MVVLMIGLNDIDLGVAPADAAGRFGQIVRRLHDAGASVIVYTVPLTGGRLDAGVADYNARITAIATASGAERVVDFNAFADGRHDRSLYLPNGDPHLSSKGYLAWAESIRQALGLASSTRP